MSNPLTPNFRLSYPCLKVAKRFDETKLDQTPKFSVSAILTIATMTDNDKLLYQAMRQSMESACMEKWKKPIDEMKKVFPKFWDPVRNGIERVTTDGHPVEGYGEGTMFFRMATTRPVGLSLARNLIVDELTLPDPEKDFYPGCYCRASYSLFPYQQDGGIGISINLVNIQKIGDGTALGGISTTPEEDFGESEAIWEGADPVAPQTNTTGTAPVDTSLLF